MRVAVTGSTGLVGSALVRALEARGDEVLTVQRHKE
ncbi:MAG: nucleoside-diphosphate-sugar epimerase, partial [Bacteroidia bacterium]